LEDKLSVIAKNSSPNASPVQLSVVSCQLSLEKFFLPLPPLPPCLLCQVLKRICPFTMATNLTLNGPTV